MRIPPSSPTPFFPSLIQFYFSSRRYERWERGMRGRTRGGKRGVMRMESHAYCSLSMKWIVKCICYLFFHPWDWRGVRGNRSGTDLHNGEMAAPKLWERHGLIYSCELTNLAWHCTVASRLKRWALITACARLRTQAHWGRLKVNWRLYRHRD